MTHCSREIHEGYLRLSNDEDDISATCRPYRQYFLPQRSVATPLRVTHASIIMQQALAKATPHFCRIATDAVSGHMVPLDKPSVSILYLLRRIITAYFDDTGICMLKR